MKVGEIMSSPVVEASPWVPVQYALCMMRDNDIGAVLVVVGDSLIGILTDRDIMIGLLSGGTLFMPVRDFMTRPLVTCYVDHDVEQAAVIMGDRQVRRLPVLDRSDKLVGIVSLCDIAEKTSEELAGQAFGEICEKR